MKQIILSGLILACLPVCGQKTFTLTAPGIPLVYTIRASQSGIDYKIDLDKKTVVDFSKLTLEFDGVKLSPDLLLSASKVRDTTERYILVTGKTSSVNIRYTEMTISFQERKVPHTKFNLIVRAFSEGIAFRYEFLGRDGSKTFMLTDERDEFRLAGNPIGKVLPLSNYTSSHEGFYTTAPLAELPTNVLFDMPALFALSGNIYVALTEAALLDYAGMYLMKEGGVLYSKLSPHPKNASVKVTGIFPHKTPWRVILVSKRMEDLVACNILTTLCPPSRITDTSWIKPGKTTFPWWNGNVLPDTINAPGNNFATQRYYIDFCKRNNIQYHSVVEYGLHQWYTDDGTNFQPGPNADVTKPVPGLNMKEVCDYAHRQGVDVRVWVHWAALYPKLDSAFAAFERWGLSGMMIDFMDRDDQEMVNIQTEMLEKAAQHHLHIQFHGAYKPTGLNRTYPNEFTREGTLNYEVNKWSEGLFADHDLDIAFTRGLAGQVDYHLGGFRAVPDSLYRTQYTRPLMHGTRCHMLGMYVVMESALSMVCDYPEAYEGEDGFDFIQQVPSAWDETSVLFAKPDEYLVVARRKGKIWYLGCINNRSARTITLPLSFLSGSNYTATVYVDGNDSRQHPNKIKKLSQSVHSSGTLTLALAPSGGSVIIFEER